MSGGFLEVSEKSLGGLGEVSERMLGSLWEVSQGEGSSRLGDLSRGLSFDLLVCV